MPQYKIVWEMDIDAKSPKGAALKARQIQADPKSIATVFYIQKDSGGSLYKIDLDGDKFGEKKTEKVLSYPLPFKENKKDAVKIWSCLIHHRHGVNHYMAKSEEGLQKQVYAYVAENWKDEMDDDHEMPEDIEEAIEEYFEVMRNQCGEEWMEHFGPESLNEIAD